MFVVFNYYVYLSAFFLSPTKLTPVRFVLAIELHTCLRLFFLHRISSGGRNLIYNWVLQITFYQLHQFRIFVHNKHGQFGRIDLTSALERTSCGHSSPSGLKNFPPETNYSYSTPPAKKILFVQFVRLFWSDWLRAEPLLRARLWANQNKKVVRIGRDRSIRF